MMKIKYVRGAVFVPAALAFAVILSGCGQRIETVTPASVETVQATDASVTEAAAEKLTEAATEAAAEEETEAVTERQTEKLITSVDYTSKDGSIKITLPDNTWKVTQDTDEMRVFQTGNAAMINIVHATTQTAMSGLTVMTTEDELKESLDSQYTTENAYEVQSFTNNTVDEVNIYNYVVKFNASERMWAYSDTYAIVTADQAYVITGTVTDDNLSLLNSVEDSVDSFRVLNDEKLKKVTSEKIEGTTQKLSETSATTEVRTDTTAEAELKTENTYSAVTLQTSDAANMRSQPSTDSDVLYSFEKGTNVSVIGETSNWFKVSVNGNIGYIRKDLLVYPTDSSQSETTASSETASGQDTSQAELATATTYGSATTLYSTSDVNIRSNPSTSSTVAGTVAAGNAVTVVGETDNWYIVNVNGSTGYISKAYLSSTAPETASSETSGNSSSTTSTETDAQTSSETTAETSSSSSGLSYLSGTVQSAGVDSMTVLGDNGQTYTVYYGDATVTSTQGIYSGVYVDITLNSSEAASDGTLYATSVTGY